MGEIRKFETGATRDTDAGKLDFEGFESPIVEMRYAEYMHKHRQMPDGSLRESDNWQKTYGEKHYDTFIKSLARHYVDLRLEHDGFQSREGVEAALCGIIFNAKSYLYKILKDRGYMKKETTDNAKTETV